ncbi:MAG: hypothetical protein H6754_06285 [Candidatus Omnitrophica bacterium]|nr:hypothetical protein [Candidatus Omnitrophota bacterium]
MKVLPEFKINLVPNSTEAKSIKPFDWSIENPIQGKRHKIGGKPEFIQESDVPICDSCKHDMSFYAQLDTIGPEYSLADCGLIYVFICFDCYETKSLIQSY